MTDKNDTDMDVNAMREHLANMVFEQSIGDLKIAEDFFKLGLSADQFEIFDWNTLRAEKTMLKNADLDASHPLFLFSAQPRIKSSEFPKARYLLLMAHGHNQSESVLVEMGKYQSALEDIYGTSVLPVFVTY